MPRRSSKSCGASDSGAGAPRTHDRPDRRHRAAGAACLTAVLLIACGGESEPVPETPGKPRVALVMKSLANEFFINMAAGARAHQAENADRYELIVNGIKNESDLAQQVSLVEQMMASQVDVIVIAPADSKGLLPVAKRAVDQGIVVVNIDNRLDAEALADAALAEVLPPAAPPLPPREPEAMPSPESKPTSPRDEGPRRQSLLKSARRSIRRSLGIPKPAKASPAEVARLRRQAAAAEAEATRLRGALEASAPLDESTELCGNQNFTARSC